MFISNICTKYPAKINPQYQLKTNVVKSKTTNVGVQQKNTTQLPLGFNTSYNITFGAWTNPNRLVGDVDLESYQIMTEKSKERYRRLFKEFSSNDEIDQTQLFDKTSKKLPLTDDETLEKFVEASKIYLNYKDQPIICLGRSPKWFLNTAFWMENGVPEYKFVAFSKFWFFPNGKGEIKRLEKEAPTEREEKEYRKYLDRVGVNPKKIVETMQKTGKKTVITDYVNTGKGMCSFLDIMARYADDLGILEEFSKSIQIVGIGSREYMEDLSPYEDDEMPSMEVPMPPILEPYADNIKQESYDIDYTIFQEMLLNQNTNECRSTYYPHNAWTVYSPDTFKTGLIRDMSKVERLLDIFKDEKYIITFSAPMQDFRNLVNFRILDYLNSKGMLRQSTKYNL